MELSQNQPTINTEGNLYILPRPSKSTRTSNGYSFPISYTTNNTTNVKARLNTPFVSTLIYDKETDTLITVEKNNILEIPLNTFLACNNRSIINIKTSSHNLTLTCKTFPNSKETFEEQLTANIKNFLGGNTFINDENNDKNILLNNEIINPTFMSRVINGDSIPRYEQGKNGHHDQKKLTDNLIKQELAHTESNITPSNNMFINLMHRQLGKGNNYRHLPVTTEIVTPKVPLILPMNNQERLEAERKWKQEKDCTLF
jgi:hypothetical protein